MNLQLLPPLFFPRAPKKVAAAIFFFLSFFSAKHVYRNVTHAAEPVDPHHSTVVEAAKQIRVQIKLVDIKMYFVGYISTNYVRSVISYHCKLY